MHRRRRPGGDYYGDVQQFVRGGGRVVFAACSGHAVAQRANGMLQVTNASFSDSIPAEWFNVFNTQSYASPGGSGVRLARRGPWMCFCRWDRIRGQSTWGLTSPRVGSFTADLQGQCRFIGYANTTNKMIFSETRRNDNSVDNWHVRARLNKSSGTFNRYLTATRQYGGGRGRTVDLDG